MSRLRIRDFHLPRYMARKGNAYYFVSRAPRKWLPLGADLHDALEAHSMLLERLGYGPQTPLLPEGYSPAAIFRLVRRSARARRLPLELTVEDVTTLVARARGRCEVTRLPFNAERPLGQRIRLYAPSVDRIDSRLGYTIANCRLVCAGVNVALNAFGESFLARIQLAARIDFVEDAASVVETEGQQAAA